MKPIDRKRCSAAAAVARIEDGQTVATGGFIGAAVPEALLIALERRFQQSQGPRDLTLLYGAGQGDNATRGLNHLAYEGLIRRVIGGHWGLAPRMGRLAIEGKIEGYNFPQGVICQLYRDIAARRPGCITHIGLNTFIDPIHQGGRLNAQTPDDGLVQRLEINGTTWLLYKAIPIHVGLIRADRADPWGNLCMDGEAIIGEVLPIAQAAHNHGGLVIAQVKRITEDPFPPHAVDVPGVLVDHIVVAGDDEHQQTFGGANPAFSAPQPLLNAASPELPQRLPMDARRLIAARACDELEEGAICNLGIGMPEGIARIAAERDLLGRVTLTVESGPCGGMPAGGLAFGASVYPQAIIDQPAMFDFYDGGGLDFAALGAAQIDRHGNVNVSMFGSRLAGVGGFVNITQSAKRLVFCGTFTTGGLEIEVQDGGLRVVREGRVRKFVHEVEQISFSADRARAVGQEVLYVTERAVFRLAANGLELIEVAPGIDLEGNVLGQMDFRPQIRQVSAIPAHVYQ